MPNRVADLVGNNSVDNELREVDMNFRLVQQGKSSTPQSTIVGEPNLFLQRDLGKCKVTHSLRSRSQKKK